MDRKFTTLAAGYAMIVLGLLWAGLVFPSSMTWGFHFAGFLPLWGLLLGTFVTAGAMIIAFTPPNSGTDRFINPFRRVGGKSWFLLIMAIFAATQFLFRLPVYLLGDNFVFINNLELTFRGVHPLSLGNEPLSIAYSYAVNAILRTTAYPVLMLGFHAGEFVLGVFFIALTLVSTRILFDDSRQWILASALMLLLPPLQLYFVYPEASAFVLTTLLLYVAGALLYLRGKIPFAILPILFTLALVCHYLLFLLVPSFIVLLREEYARRGAKPIAGGIALALVALGAFLLVTGADVSRLLPDGTRSHILPFANNADRYANYNLFSGYHLIDLLDIIALLGMPACFLVGLALPYGIRDWRPNGPYRFLRAGVAPFILLLPLLNFDLGMGRDWNIIAPMFVLVTPFALLFYFRRSKCFHIRGFIFFIIATALHAMLWFSLNASARPSTARAEALLVHRLISSEGHYQAFFHLSMAYRTLGESDARADLWKEHIKRNPRDGPGYAQLVTVLLDSALTRPDPIITVFDRWLTVDSSEIPKRRYASFLIQLGNAYASQSHPDDAERCYRQAITYQPQRSDACAGLGIIVNARGEYRQAITWFERALDADSNNVEACVQLANTLLMANEQARAIPACQRTARYDQEDIRQYLRSNDINW